ncbi:hypothetical protein PBI_SEBATA_227 [Mycobacterium phage Sebata]|uniref:HNH endonuclease n=1 Tax=Mycobacterium phage Sebata TaxID=1052672 RepID=G1FIT6_9CAUD|nr:HNH endonuclease [Mycobacterium phage Sebata]AEK06668.1 hypothetical protein PBI_SEBATA_227 [Mycobacterium phage Sebata]AYD87590.1 HNH endonuclease [Mycobacterium phage Salacia]
MQKPESDFVYRPNRPPGRTCAQCLKKSASKSVVNIRRRHKVILIEEAGGACLDCGKKYAPFLMDFDHLGDKEFGIAAMNTSLARKREEAAKCDLVCVICHRIRTHKRQCSGCEHCVAGVAGFEPAGAD